MVDEYGHFQANPPHRLAGILLRSTTRISTGSAAFWPPLLMPEPPARNQRATLVALDAVAGRRDGLGGPLAGIEDQMATNLAGHTSSPESCTCPMRAAPRPRP